MEEGGCWGIGKVCVSLWDEVNGKDGICTVD